MTLEELQTELNGLIHQTVTFKRIAGNSIIIYFFGEPSDDSVISCSLTDGITGAELISCAIDLESSDINMEFSGGQVVRNFANSGFDEALDIQESRKETGGICLPLGVTLG